MPPPSRRDVLLGTAFVLIGERSAAKAGVLRGPAAVATQGRFAAASDRARPDGSFSRRTRRRRWRRWPTGSFRPIRRRPAARTPAAPSSSTVSFGSFGASAGFRRPAVHQGRAAAGAAVRGSARRATARRSPRSTAFAARTAATRSRNCRPTAGSAAERSREGQVKLDGADGKAFFKTLLKDMQEGFFADPIYGGNRDMCGWKMIGFPGARYDYRDWVGRHNERYPPPARQHRGARRLDPNQELRRRWRASFPRKDVVIIGLGWTGSILAQRADRRRPRRRRHRARSVARRRRPTFRRPTLRTSCATASATTCSCGPTRRPSPFATRWTRRRCRSAPGAPSCRRTASAAAACTGTRRPGASCRRDFVLKTHLTAALRRKLPACRT